MAQTITNIQVTADAWVDISDVSGIASGTAYDITNQKGSWVLLYEGDAEPDIDETSGRRLAVFPDEMHSAYIASGSEKIWAKMLSSGNITGSELNVQER